MRTAFRSRVSKAGYRAELASSASDVISPQGTPTTTARRLIRILGVPQPTPRRAAWKGIQAAAMAVLDEIETCHTESAPLCSVPSDGADEQSCRADHVLSLFANQEVCVKTVKNDDWLRFVHQLNSGPFRTSVSLPPPGGRRMCLFGRVSAGAVGVVFDRRRLDLSKALTLALALTLTLARAQNLALTLTLTLALTLTLRRSSGRAATTLRRSSTSPSTGTTTRS